MLDATPNTLLWPFVGTMILTLIVWTYMYVHRLRWIASSKVDVQSLAAGVQNAKGLPPKIVNPAANFRNLFELPVIFYALCLALIVSGHSDTLHVGLAWAFLTLRCAHSLIHCTVNIVAWRFAAYALSSLCLWAMLARFVIQLL